MEIKTYFYNPQQFAWVQTLTNLYPEIKREWQQCSISLRKPKSNYNPGPKLEKDDTKWDLVPLMVRDKIQLDMLEFFPITLSLVDKVPVFENLSFSIFYPGTETISHRGWSDKIVRVHLAINTNDKSALCCGTECVSLKNGEVLIFEDSEEHYAYNRSDQERVVLLFDVLKTNLYQTNKEM